MRKRAGQVNGKEYLSTQHSDGKSTKMVVGNELKIKRTTNLNGGRKQVERGGVKKQPGLTTNDPTSDAIYNHYTRKIREARGKLK